MGLRRWREHRHYVNALATLENFSRTHRVGEVTVYEQPERDWQKGLGRREWLEKQYALGEITTAAAADIEYVRIFKPVPTPVIRLPEPRPGEINLIEVEVAS